MKNERHPSLTATILLDTFIPIKKALKSAFFIQSKRIFLSLLLLTLLFPQKIKDGFVKEYHDNGQLKSEIVYKNGKENGPYTWYWNNGNIAEKGAYKDGLLHGPIKIYSWTGELEIEGILNYAKKEGVVRGYYPNRQLKSEGVYKNDKRNGPYKWYFENGQLQSQELFKNNVEVGPFIFYHKNGQVRFKGTLTNDGIKDGVFKEYNDGGKLIGEYTWKDNELINSKEY